MNIARFLGYIEPVSFRTYPCKDLNWSYEPWFCLPFNLSVLYHTQVSTSTIRGHLLGINIPYDPFVGMIFVMMARRS